MLVYNANPGPRFHYIAGYFFEELCGLNVNFTSDLNDLEGYDGPIICYDIEKLVPGSVHIRPHGLLNQQGITEQPSETGTWNELPCFFLTGGDVPFDIFSAAFYLITRYEEYLPHKKDMYGRYAHTNSMAYRNNFLEIPLLDLWAVEFRKLFNITKADMIPGKRVFSFIPTYDIDMAWAYLHKGVVRNAGALLKLFMAGDLKQLVKRAEVLRGKRPDPFDVYEWLDALHLKFSLKPYYFFLVASGSSKYDKNIPPGNKYMRSLISYHAAGYITGIHPSWASRNREDLFIKEKDLLSSLIGTSVVHNRFHYIAFELPEGYRKLLRNGIKSDHSMGYGSTNGFRASVSTPFPWYDLEKDVPTDLMIHPYCWMDANSYYEQLYTTAQAFSELKRYHDVVKAAGGQLMTISHNNFFSDEPGFAGWKEVYEIFLDQVVYWDI
ncbi:MAG TPA: hypothetical protein VFX73_04630 [Chitinophagaceae bacterium]|nr:hypothetical protein [Chitinophagaceae bacterium]